MKSTMPYVLPREDSMLLSELSDEVFEMECEYPRWRIRVAVLIVEATDDVLVAIKATRRKKFGRVCLAVVSDDAETAVAEMWGMLLAAA